MQIEDSSVLTLWLNMLFLLSRYGHIVGAMLVVGGFLFYEMVVPVAIADLKEESQIAVFARARWVFRWILWSSVVALFLSGVYMTIWRMQTYIATEFPLIATVPADRVKLIGPWILRTGWWWAAHVVSAIFAIVVALKLVAGDRPPKYPLGILRLDLMLLLIVVFFATVTRQVDTIQQQRTLYRLMPPVMRIYPRDVESDRAETPAPDTQPAKIP